MEFIRLTDGADPRYARARALYNRSSLSMNSGKNTPS